MDNGKFIILTVHVFAEQLVLDYDIFSPTPDLPYLFQSEVAYLESIISIENSYFHRQ